MPPEAGTFNYSCDNSGNVTWLQTNYAIQTSYAYDAPEPLENSHLFQQRPVNELLNQLFYRRVR